MVLNLTSSHTIVLRVCGIRDGMMNDYEEAIEAIGSTIEKYSSSKEFP